MNSSTQAGFITTDARGKGSTGHSECGNAPTASNDSSRSGCDRTGDQRSRGQAVEWNGGNCYRLERSSCLWWLTTRGTWCWPSTYSFEEMSSCSYATSIHSNQWNFHQLCWPVYAAGLPLDLQGIKPNTQTRPANDIWPRGKDNVKQKSRTWTRESYNQCTDDEIRNGACIQVGRQNPMRYLISPLDDDNNGGVLIISRTLMMIMEEMPPQTIWFDLIWFQAILLDISFSWLTALIHLLWMMPVSSTSSTMPSLMI